VLEYIHICRPTHWLKNIFILFGHAVAAVLVFQLDLTSSQLGIAALSLIPACFIASANYILNEILDAPFDALHPTKKNRGIPAGKVSVPILWAVMAALIIVGFAMSFALFNWAYTAWLATLLVSGVVYNVPPIRLKDRVYFDVIAESFNNPIRLGLGYYALVPPDGPLPPLSIVLAWWSFGGLLMTGKRYAEFRLINCDQLSAKYRKSFEHYNLQRLVIAMITYANIFCFCTGVAMTSYPQLNNLVFIFPFVIATIILYFRHAMSEVGAQLEPEELLKNPWIILITILISLLSLWLLTTDVDLIGMFHIINPDHLGE
jgi:decaprenyl-phosphate phosphoribosyltransferase